MNDPELKAMAAVYDALKELDAATRTRVTDWVLAKLKGTAAAPAKPAGKKRGRKPGKKNAAKATGAKRGRKPGVKAAKKTGKRGRPAGSTKKAATKAVKSTGKRRGRPRKVAAAAPAGNAA